MMEKQVLITVGASKNIISFTSSGRFSDVSQVKNALFKKSETNAKLHEWLNRSNNFTIQKFSTKFNEYIDLEEDGQIEDKAKLNLVYLEQNSATFVGNGQQFPQSSDFHGPMRGPQLNNLRAPMGSGNLPTSSFPSRPSVPSSLQLLHRMPGIGPRGPGLAPGQGNIRPAPRFQGGSFLRMTELKNGIGPRGPGLAPGQGGSFLRMTELTKGNHAEEVIKLKDLVAVLEGRRQARSPSPSPDLYHRRSRSPEYQRRYSPPSRHYRRRSRSRSPDYRREPPPGRDDILSFRLDEKRSFRHDEGLCSRHAKGSNYQDFSYRREDPSLRENHGQSEAFNDGGKKLKYSWDEVMHWEDEELGFKYKESEDIRKIYDAANCIRTKQPVQLLNEYAQKREWKNPVFTLTLDGTGTREPVFKFQVEVNGMIYESDRYSQNKKQAKVYAAIKALYNLKVI